MKLLNGIDLLRMFQAGTSLVIKKRKLLNDINVFPVPDGDTGNNLVYTMQTISTQSKEIQSFKESLDVISENALIGARGNSGVIFAQFVNGLRASNIEKEEIDATDFAYMANTSVGYVYKALATPVEGTMITIIKDWAESLEENKDRYQDIKELLLEAYEAAKKSLERTPELLKVLKKNKVVDSGAMGFVLFLEGFNKYLNNEEIDYEVNDDLVLEHVHDFEGEILHRYCTEGLVKYTEVDETEVTKSLESLGDSLITVKGKDMFRIHIHTNTPEKVFEQLDQFGHIVTQKVDDMLLEVNTRKNKKKIALVTDSIADISDELKTKYNVYVLPTSVIVNNVSYLDKYTINNKILFDKIETISEYPTTSTPDVKSVSNMLMKLLLAHEEIIIISVASKLSGTHNTIASVVNTLVEKGNKIKLVDSNSNSASEGLLVLEAAKMIEDNKSLEEIETKLNELKAKAKILVCLDTFKYATMSGRVPKAVGKIGMAIGLRPIMSLNPDGSGTAFGFAFTQKSITKKIVKLIKKELETGIESYSLVHCLNESLVKEYETLFTELIGKQPEYITDISSATAIHSGVGSVAIGYIKK